MIVGRYQRYMETEDDILVRTVCLEIYERLGGASIFSLPWVPQVVGIIEAAQGVIDNGGFIYFFEQDWIDQPPYSVFGKAFRAIGADECADCIEVAASLFPFPDPQRKWEARREYMISNCMIGDRVNYDSILVKLGDRVIDHSDTNYALLALYIRQHLDEIRSLAKGS